MLLAARRVRALLVAAVALVAAKDAGADPTPPDPVRVSWVREDGAESCPDARAIDARVRERLGKNPVVRDPLTTAEVVVEGHNGSFVARIRVRTADGTLIGARTITSEDGRCDTLASAAALAIALYIDPDAALRPKTPAPPPPPPKPIPAPPKEAPPPRPSDRGLKGALTAGAMITDDLVPSFALAARISAELEPAPRLHLLMSGMLVPEERTSDGRFAFGLAAAGAGGCFDVIASRPIELAPCVELQAGEIHSVVYSLDPTTPGGRAWGGASATARLRVLLTGHLALDAAGGAVVPLIRYDFRVAGHSDTVFQEPFAAPVGMLGVTVTIP